MARIFQSNPPVRGLPRRLAADRRGVTAIVTGIALAVLLGFAGLGVDVAAWLNATRGLQAAADQAAYSAAVAAGAAGCPSPFTGSKPYQQAFAIAGARGYPDGEKGVVVDPTCDSTKSVFTVTISQPQPMWFTSLFLAKAPEASASASAQLAGKASDLCILALDGTNPEEGVIGDDASAFWLNGNTNIDVHCGVAVDSQNAASLSVGGSADLTATDLYLVGDDQGSPSGSGQINVPAGSTYTHQLAVSDPYAGRVIGSYSCGSYSMTQLDSGTLTQSSSSPGASAHTFCGGLSLGGTSPSTISISSGVYVIAGGSLTFNDKATISGTGVTFILTGDSTHGYATVTINGGPQSSLSLTAPTSGPYGGMVFFQDRNAPFSGNSSTTTSCGSGTSQNQLTGGANQLLTGAVYFPNQSVCWGGGSSTSGAGSCTQLIAHTLSFTGSSGVESYCTGTGVSPISVLTPQLIK